MVHWGLTLKPHTNPEGYSKQKDVNMEDLTLFNEVFETVENKQDATEIMVILRKINDLINKDQENFIELCYYFKLLKEHFDNIETRRRCMWYNGYDNKNGRWYYERIIQDFGLEENTVNRMIQIVNRFTEQKSDVGLKIRSVFLGYSKSKLFELLALSDTQIERGMQEEKLRPEMTVKAIREYAKTVKGGANTENKVLEDTSNDDYEAKAEEITDCGLYLKLNKESFDYVKNVVDKYKSKYKDANVFLNALIKYAIDNKLFL